MTALTSYHQTRWLKTILMSFLQVLEARSLSQKQGAGRAVLAAEAVRGESVSYPFQVLVAAGISWLVATSLQSQSPLVTLSSLPCHIYFFLCPVNTFVIAFRVYLIISALQSRFFFFFSLQGNSQRYPGLGVRYLLEIIIQSAIYIISCIHLKYLWGWVWCTVPILAVTWMLREED
jgi:hypothetical protein